MKVLVTGGGGFLGGAIIDHYGEIIALALPANVGLALGAWRATLTSARAA